MFQHSIFKHLWYLLLLTIIIFLLLFFISIEYLLFKELPLSVHVFHLLELMVGLEEADSFLPLILVQFLVLLRLYKAVHYHFIDSSNAFTGWGIWALKDLVLVEIIERLIYQFLRQRKYRSGKRLLLWDIKWVWALPNVSFFWLEVLIFFFRVDFRGLRLLLCVIRLLYALLLLWW